MYSPVQFHLVFVDYYYGLIGRHTHIHTHTRAHTEQEKSKVDIYHEGQSQCQWNGRY